MADPRSRFDRPLQHLPVTAWIASIWVGLWGDISLANIIAGAFVGVLLSFVVPLPPSARRYRPSLWGTCRFLLIFGVALARSTWDVARKVLHPPAELRPAALEIVVGPHDPLVLAMAANATTMTPGTMTLEVDPERGTMLIHCLHLEEGMETEIETSLLRFVSLAEAALRPRHEPVTDVGGGL